MEILEEVEVLRDFDELIAAYANAGRAPSRKEIETLRAKVAYTLAPYRPKVLVFPPIAVEEIE